MADKVAPASGDDKAEEHQFLPDDVSNIIKEACSTVLDNQVYDPSKVSQWTSSCLENCIKRLVALQKPFKYVVTCVLVQKNGAGVHTAASCWWDNTTDGSRTIKIEGKSIIALMTVFGLAI